MPVRLRPVASVAIPAVSSSAVAAGVAVLTTDDDFSYRAVVTLTAASAISGPALAVFIALLAALGGRR